MQYAVYILHCSDGSYYTGITNNVESRVAQHNAGIDPKAYTFKRRPVKLVYSSYFTEVTQAIAWEKTLKRWSRAKKKALVRGDYDALPSLSFNEKQRGVLSIQEETRERVMVRSLEP